jgi:protein O-mannosyl-transferase
MKNSQKWALPLKGFIIILILLSTIFIAYRDALNNGFLTMWDTQEYVIYNNHIKALTWENIQWMFTHFHVANWHPLTWLSHALDYAWFGMNPWGHHLVNILFHGLNTILLFLLVIGLLSFKPAADKLSQFAPVSHKTLLAAGIAAFLFGIHPQHVESVVWIAERKDVLCLFFILLALLSYLFYNAAQAKKRVFWYLSTLFCFVLALLAKPMAITLPVILLLMDVYPLNRTSLTGSQAQVSYKSIVLEKIPFFAFTVLSAILTILAQHSSGAMSTLEGLGLEIRILNAFNSLIFYISKFIFPIGLSPLYPLPSYQSVHDYYPSLIPVIAVFMITFVCGYLWYKKQYYWLIAWLFYLVTLSPVIGIIQVGSQAAADRYVYLPTIPFYILLGFGVAKVVFSQKVKSFLKWGTVLGLLLFSFVLIQLTQKQTAIWKNDLTFWGYVAAYAPNNILAHNNLGDVYVRMGEYEKAVERYQHTLSLNPPHFMKRGGAGQLALAYMKLERLQEALEIVNYLINNKIFENYQVNKLYAMRGEIYFKLGLLPAAQESLTKALALNPKNEKARKLLSEINAQ